MEATQNDGQLQTGVELWLRSCHGCMELVTNPMGSTCGHLFCTMCLVEEGVITPPRTCPACNAPLSEEAMENPTTTATTAVLMNHVPSRARMEVVQGMISASKERNYERRVELLTRLSELRGERIAELERGMDSMMGLCTEQEIQLDLKDTAMSEMRARIEQLEREKQQVERGRDIMARENTQLMREMIRMRGEMGARIAQRENDPAGRAITDSETGTD